MNEDFDTRLGEARKSQETHHLTEEQERNAENIGTGLRAGGELVGAIIAGTLIGWGLDRWLHTKPLFLIIMLLLGIITGFVNVWRITQNTGSAVGYSELHNREKNARTLPDENRHK